MKYKFKQSVVLTVKDPAKVIKGGKPARKYKKSLFVIQYHIYPFNLVVSVNQSKEELAKSLVKSFKHGTVEEYLSGPLSNEYGARTLMFDCGGTLIHFPELCECSHCNGLIAHEVFHAVEFLFDKIELKHSMEFSSEAFAYLIGYIVEEIHKKLYG